MKTILNILSYICFLMALQGLIGVCIILFPCAIYIYFNEGLNFFVLWNFIGILGWLGLWLFTNIRNRIYE